MRQLVLLRGPMGVERSTYVIESGLGPYTLSADKIRILFSAYMHLCERYKYRCYVIEFEEKEEDD